MNASIDGLDVERLLAAGEGISYLVDPDGTILALGEPGWSRFAMANGGDSLHAGSLVGRSLFSAIDGEEVRLLYEGLHAKLRAGSRSEVIFAFRCDSPDTVRHMRMSVAAVTRGSAIAAILYHSVVLDEIARPPTPLITSESVGRAHPSRAPDDAQLVRVCSWCLRVRWPIGAATPKQGVAWITAEDYAHGGGHPDAPVSHGICQNCRVAWMNAGA